MLNYIRCSKYNGMFKNDCNLYIYIYIYIYIKIIIIEHNIIIIYTVYIKELYSL